MGPFIFDEASSFFVSRKMIVLCWHPKGMREGSQGQAKRSPWNVFKERPRPEGARENSDEQPAF